MTTFEPTPLGFSPQFMLENGRELRWGVRGCVAPTWQPFCLHLSLAHWVI